MNVFTACMGTVPNQSILKDKPAASGPLVAHKTYPGTERRLHQLDMAVVEEHVEGSVVHVSYAAFFADAGQVFVVVVGIIAQSQPELFQIVHANLLLGDRFRIRKGGQKQ